MQAGSDDFLFSGKDLISQQLLLYLFKADSAHRVCKTLSRISLFPEKKDCLFQNGKYFFLTGEDSVKRLSVRGSLSPAPAYVNLIAIGSFIRRMERAFSDTASAVIALFFIDYQLAVRNLCGAHRTDFRHLALGTSAAAIYIISGNPLSDNTKII